jgi:hypothetical protein
MLPGWPEHQRYVNTAGTRQSPAGEINRYLAGTNALTEPPLVIGRLAALAGS